MVEEILPDSLIAVSTPPLSFIKTLTPQKCDKHDMQTTARCTTILEESTPIEQEYDCTNLTHLDKSLDIIEEPDTSETGAQEDFNIDHSMLDPKMLLQCYMNKPHEELLLIPPPPRFCDTQSIESSNIEIKRTPVDPVQEEVNFQDDHDVIGMTPKEIDTWTFDEDSYDEPAEPMSEHFQNYACNINSISAYKCTLGQFKFNSKQRYNARRK